MSLFGTAGIRGPVADEVTPRLALAIGQAAGRDGDEFVVGHDGRTTSPALADAVAAGLQSAGADVRRAGSVPTPALAHASRGRRGVMVTASHNPPADNGLKLFVDGSEYDRSGEERIAERVTDDDPPAPWREWAESRQLAAGQSYRDAVVDYATDHGSDATDLAVAVDCGNGVAARATPQVLRQCGASVVALEANVDGTFPARRSKPTPESLGALRSFVAERDVDVGIAHDGDGDRIAVVDSHGEVVHEDTVVAILAEHFVERAEVTDPVVVTTPNASGRIDERVAVAGGRTERVRLGALHEGIAAADGTVVFAAEPWKHVHPALGGWIDGVASAAVLVRLVAARGLKGLREPVDERPYRKVSLDCPDDAKASVMAVLTDRLRDAFPDADVNTDHGVRLTLPSGGWTLVRPSGTEPYVRLYAESENVDELVGAVTDVVTSAVDDAT